MRAYPVIGRPISPHGRLPGHRIEWRVSLRTQAKFYDLLAELVDLEMELASEERDNRMEALRDDIRSLPGYPRRYDPDRDLIVPVLTTEMK